MFYICTNNFNIMNEKIGYPKQLKYKEMIEASGWKKSHVAKKIDISNGLLSRYINGKIYMPASVIERLVNFLNNQRNP